MFRVWATILTPRVFCVKDACVRNKRWHALALLLDRNGQKPRGEKDETAAAETWRSLALGHLTEGVDTDGEGAVAARGAQSVACEFATENLTRIADDALDRRMDDDVSRIVMCHVAWITDVDKHAGLALLTRPRTLTCLPLRTATRVLEESKTCGESIFTPVRAFGLTSCFVYLLQVPPTWLGIFQQGWRFQRRRRVTATRTRSTRWRC